MKMRPLRLAALATVVGLAGAAAATAAAVPSGKAAGTPIVIQVNYPDQNPSVNQPDIRWGAEGAAAAINKKGGINGHPITVVACNDSNSAPGRQDCARKGTDPANNVVACLCAPDAYESFPIWTAAGIVQIGAANTQPAFVQPLNYPFTGASVLNYMSEAAALKKAGAKSLAIVSFSNASALSLAVSMKTAAKAAHLPYKGTVAVPLTPVADYSPYAQKVKDMGADAIGFVTNVAVGFAFVRALQNLGVTKIFPATTGASLGDFEAQTAGPDSNGWYVASTVPPPGETESYPALKDYMSETLAVSDEKKHGAYGELAWLEVYGFATIAKTIKGDITKDSFRKAIQAWPKGKIINVKGIIKWDPNGKGPAITPRLSSTQGQVWLSKVVNQHLVLQSKKPIEVFSVLGLAKKK
jgi:ABC-type branched-subunit amino acid transport system substrate-binding protein